MYQWYDSHKATDLAAVRCSPPATEKSLCLLGPLVANQPTHFGNLKEVFLCDSRKISIFVKGIPDAYLGEDISRL